MSFSYGFFNAKNMDRTYTADDFTNYLSSIICNGVFDTYGDCFSVTAGNGTSVVIGTGKAWIDGHYFINDTAYTLDLSKYADESLSRYVTIGISCDVSENVRACKLEVKSGTAATTPTIPVFENTASKKYITLAAVFLKGGTKNIINDNIFDMREDEKKCGYVKCVLGKCRVSEILMALAVYRSTVADLTKQVQDLSSHVASLTTRLDDFTADVTAVGSIGDSAYYIMYSNGRLAIRGTGATYDYDIGNSPFFENTEITSLDVGEGITALGSSLFERCTNMTEISLPTTLTAIGERCFFMYSVGGLKSLVIPKNVKTIAEKAFVCCAVESVTIPFNVKEIGSYAFNECAELKSAYVDSPLVSSFMFTQCSALANLTLSKNVKSINAYCINYCGSLKEITYEGTVTDLKAVVGYQNLMNASYCPLERISCVDGAFVLNGETWEEVMT
ncbi:MAG: leucine-rich repeat domain-containing protein [Ruminococcus sp.]|nr:leucine-rich repeat domain-containing protein [Ruminococcus sp.]